MLERPPSGERTVLVHLTLPGADGVRDPAELRALAASAGAFCVGSVSATREAPDARYFIGSGKAQELRETVLQTAAELVIFDHELAPSQERNLEKLLECRVLDRTGLILDIFAQRARSFEGKLQVELAQLKHLSTRLVRGWTHLERQKGGIGLRGPGESQLETDRRLIAERIRRIDRRLEKVAGQRDRGRQARRRAEVPAVSLVGYTNAGKSTLFNRLTGAGAYAADQLFATLDPILRRLELPQTDPAVIVDTVGFVSRLPHELVAAFRSTLQETCEASLLLHVIDAGDVRCMEHADQVERVLAQIGAGSVPRIRVFNKIDRLGKPPRLSRDPATGLVRDAWVSAASGAGCEALVEAVAERLRGDTVHGWVRLPPEAGRLRARLFGLGAVLSEHLSPQGEWLIEVRTSCRNLRRFCRQEGLSETRLEPEIR